MREPADICQPIALDGHEIRGFSRSDRADAILPADQRRRVDGGGLQHLHRCHATVPDHERELLRVLSVRINSGVGAEGHLHTRRHRLVQTGVLDLRHRLILAKNLHGPPLCPARLPDVFAIDEVGDEIRSVLLHQPDRFVVEHRAVLDRCHTRAHRGIDAVRAVRMRRDACPVLRRLGDRSVDLLLAELLHTRLGPRREHGAGRDDLDHVGAVIQDLTHTLPDLAGVVRDAEPHVGWKRDIGGHPRDFAASAAHRDVRARDCHARPHHEAAIDVVAQRHIEIRAEGSDIAYGREAREQRSPRVHHAIERLLRGRALEGEQHIGIGLATDQMRVAVDEPRGDRVPREIDHLCTGWYVPRRGLHRHDPVATHDDHLIAQHLSGLDIHEPAGPHGSHHRAVRTGVRRRHEIRRLHLRPRRGRERGHGEARGERRASERVQHHGAL